MLNLHFSLQNKHRWTFFISLQNIQAHIDVTFAQWPVFFWTVYTCYYSLISETLRTIDVDVLRESTAAAGLVCSLNYYTYRVHNSHMTAWPNHTHTFGLHTIMHYVHHNTLPTTQQYRRRYDACICVCVLSSRRRIARLTRHRTVTTPKTPGIVVGCSRMSVVTEQPRYGSCLV